MNTPRPGMERAYGLFLFLTAALTGALVMVVEVLGSRVMGPLFGVSLFVWTALITVTLLALAAGYAIGGWWADRHPTPTPLYILIMASGGLLVLVPILKVPVLQATLPMGLRAGAFCGALLLFGPALFLLGCVSPYVVRIAVREWGRLGRTVGLLYAVSTAGSFLGTLITGFFLIGYLGVAQAFFWAGGLLIALGAVYFAWFRNRHAILLLIPAALVAFPRDLLPAVTLADGTVAQVVHREDSFYGNLKVVDYMHGAVRTRELMIDGLVQGGIDLANGLSVYEYPYLLQHLPVLAYPGGRRCLVIGVGAAVVPRWYEARGIETDVVDINPRVVEAARRFFGYRPKGGVFIEDARTFLARAGAAYDYIIVDVFNGDTTPAHLVTREALGQVKSRLNPGGVVAINLIGSLGDDGEMTRAVVDTVRSVFSQLSVHPVFEADEGGGSDNLVILAQEGARGAGAVPADSGIEIHPLAERVVRLGLSRTVELSRGSLLLTDDFNPIDVRDVRLKERLRRQILDAIPAAILLSSAAPFSAANRAADQQWQV